MRESANEKYKAGDKLAVSGLILVTYVRKKNDVYEDSPMIVVEYTNAGFFNDVAMGLVLMGSKDIKVGSTVSFFLRDARPFYNELEKDGNLLLTKNRLPEI